MHRFTCTVGLVLLTGACTPPSTSLGAGQSEDSSGTSDSVAESSTADDANGSTAVSTDGNGDCDAICCESVENPATICTASQTQQDCEAAQVGDDWCFWVEWRPTAFDGLACVLGPPEFECRHQRCQEEGCVGPFFCPGGSPGIVARSGPEGTEIGLGNWCLEPDGTTQCRWDFEGNLSSGPPECVCGCEDANLCDAPFAAYLAQLASVSKTDAMDCGALENGATLAEWQAVHDCTLAAAAAGQTFVVSWGEQEADLPNPDVEERYGYVGIQGESYEIVHAHSDRTANGQSIIQQTCSALMATEGCTVAEKQPCITCVDASMSTQVCSEA
jgi:hypothetical protein